MADILYELGDILFQFFDEAESRIVSEFSSRQDPDVLQNLGQVDYKDERHAEFINPQKSMSLPALSKS
ncbi:hypothetical protein [Pseudomonas lini]|uniref:hypothetical protein n=1 Tax=Pseudomonas lini TaxID=163011 RepID=UPI00345EEFD8